MKQPLTILLFLIGRLCFANMASPIWEGTFSSSAFSSRDIDILREKIVVTIDKDFRTAFFQIEYFIRADASGRQIPLLFHAKDYEGDFKIWVDNRAVTWRDIPPEYRTTGDSPFEKFSSSFKPPHQSEQSETVEIYWEENSGFIYDLNELKYFETDLAKGEHQIRVEYTANVWTDISDWVKEYSFRYSLSPAKSWKSFGSLEVTIDASDFGLSLTTNLGEQNSGRLYSVAVWNFSTLPADYIEVIYKPKVNALARAMIAMDPFGLTLVFALLMVFLHVIGIRKYRESRPTKRYSWVVIVGSVALPFLILIGYMVSFDIIDSIIGQEAGRYHGYTFIVMILYPLLVPVYWIIMWLIDKRIKRRLSNARL